MRMLLVGEGRGWWDSGSRPRPGHASAGLCSLAGALPILVDRKHSYSLKPGWCCAGWHFSVGTAITS